MPRIDSQAILLKRICKNCQEYFHYRWEIIYMRGVLNEIKKKEKGKEKKQKERKKRVFDRVSIQRRPCLKKIKEQARFPSLVISS